MSDLIEARNAVRRVMRRLIAEGMDDAARVALHELDSLNRRSILRGTLEDRYRRKVVKGFGCWGWTGATDRFGYGVIGIGGRDAGNTTAHRASWQIHNGPIPDGMYVLHSCDNPPCSNPEHLFLGTHLDNVADMVAKRRHVGARS